MRIAPGTARYRSASHTTLQQQVGGQPQESHEARVVYFTADLTPRGEALRVTLTVDSISRYNGGSAPSGADHLRGVTFTGNLEPDGEIHDLAGGDSTERVIAELAEGLAHVYPRIPPHGLEPGAAWTDTTRTTAHAGGLPLTVVAVSHHRADPPTGGEGAIPLRTETTYTYSGQGTQGGQTYSVTGEGRRHTLELLGLDGLFRGATSADTSTFSLSLPALDVTMPGRQTRADTLSLLPR